MDILNHFEQKDVTPKEFIVLLWSAHNSYTFCQGDYKGEKESNGMIFLVNHVGPSTSLIKGYLISKLYGLGVHSCSDYRHFHVSP